ncbi:pyridoxal-dependent decarboxylase [Streptomyces sp. V2]|uniref:pyridoxal phosphate-dependent decarboxylase family protein n=1 Tax=Streptomyces sp. V2 TaxID=1424099 RepID=UPI000D66B6E9|nr:aspartate aminotransferase family protein [Streptomyces sp. V2]PWG14122.1 pyridoxal-dependent decarboxylase [Streptomyces sp. V2]
MNPLLQQSEPCPLPPPAPGVSRPYAQLLNQAAAEDYRNAVVEGVERVATRLQEVERPFTGISPAELEPDIAAIDLEQPLGDLAEVLDEVEDIYLRDAVYFHHPRYLAHLNCPVVIPAVVGEAVLSAVNSSLDTWDQSAGATLIERRLIDWAAGRVGFGPLADGVFTSGGTQSNLQALMMARDEACRQVREASTEPLRDVEVLPRLRILTSECGHFSVVKAAALLGLGREAVVTVACDGDMRMRPEALAAELERCAQEQLVPAAVVATAGTTDFGSIDPLPAIAGLCERWGVWLHVDAAYGCGLLVSGRRRHLLEGVERANSVTVDFHKSLFQPVSSSAVLVRDREMLRYATLHADYLNPAHRLEERIPNQVDKSIQTTRRFDALKLWMTLRVMGAEGIGELFDEVVDRADHAWRLMARDQRFDVVTRPTLSTLVFRYEPRSEAGPEAVDRANLYAREMLSSAGVAVIAATVVKGRHHLKFTLLNPETSIADIAYVLELIAVYAEKYLAGTADGAPSRLASNVRDRGAFEEAQELRA